MLQTTPYGARFKSVPAVSPRQKKKIFVLRPWRSFLPGIGSARSPPMKNNDDIHSTDTNEIKQLINRVKQGELDQGDALLIEELLSILLTIVSLLERKHTSIQRMKELLFGMKEKKRGKDEDKNRAEDGRPGVDGSSQTDSPNEMNSTCEDVRRLKRPGHGRMAASDYPGAGSGRLTHPEMPPGVPFPDSGGQGHL